jgi:hypothetical protein
MMMRSNTSTTIQQKIRRYVLTLRNAEKREYAEKFSAYVLNGRNGNPPEYPATLSFMGAQAVRLAIDEIYPNQ